MRKIWLPLLALLSLLPLTAAQAAREVHSLGYPALSAGGQTVYFTAWGDIWAAPVDGSREATRLTDNVAFEGRPLPSPDGARIAFVSDRYGDYDLFVMPSDGGAATRLTWDSTADYLYDWRPDGGAILGYTQRQDLWALCAYEYPLDGTAPVRVTGPDHDENVHASYLGDSEHLVYTRGPGDWARRRHWGSDTYDLWLYDRANGRHTQLTAEPGNDLWPQPSPDGSMVYFVSARGGTENLWSIDPATRETIQLTHFADTPVHWPRISSDGDEIAFECEGEIWLLRIGDPAPRKLAISFSDDPKHVMANQVDLYNEAGDFALSPNGNYFAVSVYGELFILKNPKGYPEGEEPEQDLSRSFPVVKSPGRETQIAWHPDNTKIAYLSDRDGQFDVYLLDLKTLTEQRLTITEADEWIPQFAPQGDQLAYYSGNRKLMLFDLQAGSERLLREGQMRHGPWSLGFAWSPDGAWLAFAEAVRGYFADVFLLKLSGGEPVCVDQNPFWTTDPAFSKDGKWLAFSQDTRDGGEVMLLELNPEKAKYDTQVLFPEDLKPEEPADDVSAEAGQDDAKTPSAGEVSEEPVAPGDEAATEGKIDEEGKENQDEEEDKVEPVIIDLNRIHLRAHSITPLQGSAFYPIFDPNSKFVVFFSDMEGELNSYAVDLDGENLHKLGLAEGESPQFAPDGTRLYLVNEGRLTYFELTESEITGQGEVPLTSRLDFDQYGLWDQMLKEGWRHLRDSYYDPGMNGADWPGVLARYLPRVREAGTRTEFSELYRLMLGEMGGSHLGFYGLPGDGEEPGDQTGRLGVLFDEQHSGEGWLVDKVLVDGPADQPGSKLYPGDLILTVNGTAVAARDDQGRVLRNLVGIPTKLVVQSGAAALEVAQREAAAELEAEELEADEEAPAEDTAAPEAKPDLPEGQREVVLMPVGSGELYQIAYEQWVEDNRAAVYAASDSQVAYQHIQQNDGESLAKFERELFTESYGKKALIIDMRFNGGGGIAEQLVDIIDRRPFAQSAHRDAERSTEPVLRWEGPIVMLINAHCYSDAEITPWIFKDLGLATILGEPTGGNVIGTYDFALVDGSQFRLPSWGWWRLNGQDMEGNGCTPDIYVHIDPQAMAQGHDNQLEAAVKFLEEQISKPLA